MKQDAENRNIVWHPHQVTKEDRTKLNGHGGAILWFTGLSGSGKSTLANAVESVLFERRLHSFILDGDNIRHGLNKDLGFSPKDREENIRRIGEVAHLFAQAGLIAMTAFISPYKSDRDKVRALAAPKEFIEVYVKCNLETCEKRDTKGLYKKARAGQIPEFTGISAPYEEPEAPELVVHTDQESLEESAAKVIAYLESQGIVPKK
ncbi:MAG: adenylyl-sulfate kinase [Candidatus Omnitrophica bacterium]|nr:adenylyl-sulfate kinase [Candidatus Omnitrophota bacterium]